MKKILLFLNLFLSAQFMRSQVVFCPPGARWNYEFTNTIFDVSTTNQQITYVGDSIVGNDTLRVLNHNYMFLYCSDIIKTTLIKQRGDTIFFKNSKTQGNWEVLYNFATQAGQSWQTTVVQRNNLPTTFTFTVDSVSTVIINGFNLRRLFLHNNGYVTERFGSNKFLFNYQNSGLGFCDATYFEDNLCYYDNNIGTVQFTSNSCNHTTPSAYTAIADQTEPIPLIIYPNPTTNFLNIEINRPGNYALAIIDILGRPILNTPGLESKTNIDIKELKAGIYFAHFYEGEKLIGIKKIVKE